MLHCLQILFWPMNSKHRVPIISSVLDWKVNWKLLARMAIIIKFTAEQGKVVKLAFCQMAVVLLAKKKKKNPLFAGAEWKEAPKIHSVVIVVSPIHIMQS